MTKRFLQLQLASQGARGFAAATAKQNRAVAENARAPREGRLYSLALSYRVKTPRPAGT